MLNRNKIIAGTLAVSAIMGTVSSQLVYAEENTNEDSVYEAKDNNGITWSYRDIEEDETIGILGTDDVKSYMEIPDTLDGKKVLAVYGIVKNSADTDKLKTVTKVKLADSVLHVDSSAFEGFTNLTDIEMPIDVDYIGDEKYVFQSCPNVKINGNANPGNYKNFKSGWNSVGNYKYYLNSDGKLQIGWMDLNGKKYYFYRNGQMASGLLILGYNTTYYLDQTQGSNFGNLVTGWAKIDGCWYYFNTGDKNEKEKGLMQTGWQQINGSMYHFNSSGRMDTGLTSIGGDSTYYYFDDSNSSSKGIMKTGWQEINGSWYYFARKGDSGTEGQIEMGWQYIDGSWYYLNKIGDPGQHGIMRTGWQKIDGTWYYFYDSGSMAHDVWIGGYYLNSDGAWVG